MNRLYTVHGLVLRGRKSVLLLQSSVDEWKKESSGATVGIITNHVSANIVTRDTLDVHA